MGEKKAAGASTGGGKRRGNSWGEKPKRKIKSDRGCESTAVKNEEEAGFARQLGGTLDRRAGSVV